MGYFSRFNRYKTTRTLWLVSLPVTVIPVLQLHSLSTHGLEDVHPKTNTNLCSGIRKLLHKQTHTSIQSV